MTGGAIFADAKSFVRLYAAQLRHNEAVVGEWHRVFAGDKITSGGAMVLVSSTAEIVQGTDPLCMHIYVYMYSGAYFVSVDHS